MAKPLCILYYISRPFSSIFVGFNENALRYFTIWAYKAFALSQNFPFSP